MTDPQQICRNFMHQKCTRTDCKFIHDLNICFHFWKYQNCKFDTKCKKQHICNVTNDITINQEDNKNQENKNTKNKDKYNKKKIKNTESFIPINKNSVDMRIVTHLTSGKSEFNEVLTTKDVVVVPDLFLNDQNVSYEKLVYEIENCGIPEEDLLKWWHGNDKIKGTHLIADDKLDWKTKCPTFNYVISKIQNYFNLDIKSTRFNWYKNHNDWKPLHHDAAAIKPHIAKIQNFTLAISFGTTRDTVFEKTNSDKSKTFISMPQNDRSIYAFCNDTNSIWKHGILPGSDDDTIGRISLIMWGWMNNIK